VARTRGDVTAVMVLPDSVRPISSSVSPVPFRTLTTAVLADSAVTPSCSVVLTAIWVTVPANVTAPSADTSAAVA
jgi:hypothetical protein